ncbi:hypothetical protein DSO57_1013434 [Entomophthora muscae]|uniref:Uncharacterized protein n=1 Tax=Entomophthora muscae TaxID=34485 RepID=A0ACC2TSY4_9FUNG|nr:hypothetical protein DSO57_1013434 [Entomophthora muscae]
MAQLPRDPDLLDPHGSCSALGCCGAYIQPYCPSDIQYQYLSDLKLLSTWYGILPSNTYLMIGCLPPHYSRSFSPSCYLYQGWTAKVFTPGRSLSTHPSPRLSAGACQAAVLPAFWARVKPACRQPGSQVQGVVSGLNLASSTRGQVGLRWCMVGTSWLGIRLGLGESLKLWDTLQLC